MNEVTQHVNIALCRELALEGAMDYVMMMKMMMMMMIQDIKTLWECVCSFTHSALVKVKIKFTLEQATKAQRGSRVIALLFL